ncbi:MULTISPECIES: Tim44 domain-containing protein [Agrobacterium]|uniref:Tim44 domain-containing protein n=1 Tax=Agrobacterium TaxID=357 RepID=UPI0022B8467D|nr:MULTISPECIES: Tim44 domain-containing protein [Agrobacterium]MCZ7886165.1 Tim44 domain-containing protein [Agrobacterium salinitolerans]MDA5631055.1 Tim44 domain-containing protein [Agrobacterium sp. ST15.16.055]MDA6979375.1 Tim44 domain-containing protein [Agrobacterium salinitolerans]
MFAAFRRFKGLFAVAALGIAVSFVAVDMAEARRASGGFGSRGTRTYSAPPSTSTAPGQTAPINRSMTPNTNQAAPSAAQPARPGAQAPQQSRGLFGGMMGGLMGGLLMGGLFGMLLGGGFGGMAGFFGMLLQVALIGLLVMLAMRFFASRRQGQPAYGAAGASQRRDHSGSSYNGGSQPGSAASSFKIPKIGALAGAAGGVAANAATAKPATHAPAPHANAMSEGDEIGITQGDLETFQKMLEDVQAAYAAEDYGTLRKLTTPEAMSYLAEELSDNATSGVKNDVRDVTLLQGDVAEAWHEEGQDYATVAMRYSAIDVMRDRTSGKVIEGDEHQPSEAVEMWTFVRRPGNDNWQVAAIQAAA